MGRTKKKLPDAAPKEVTAGNSTGDNPPTPRKRGRPRKVVVQETAKAEEADTIEEKQPKVSEDAGSKGGTQKKKQIESSGGAGSSKKGGEDKGGSSEESSPKPKAAKREGSRRKSEPRRAAGSLVSGR